MEPDNDKTRTHIPLTAGTMVTHYRIIEKIGAGGMGEVFLADDTELDRKVALKFLPPNLCQDEECRARFKREAQAAAKLDHPNIVTIYEVSEYLGRPFFSMQHVEGQSLRDYARGKDLEIERVVNLAIQICDGLKAAHDKNIIHRDIKPSNIVIDAYGRPRILDFGLAAVQGGEHLTKTGSTLGTIRYMSPEQLHGREVDHRSDLFSLGVVLYELITGHSPFARDNDMATGQAIINDIPDPLAKYRSSVPDALQAIISKLLDKDPDLRYQAASGIIPDLRRLQRKSDSDSLTSEYSGKRGSGKIWAIVAALVVVIVFAGYFAFDKWFPTAGKSTDISRRAAWTNSIAVLPFRDFSTTQDQEPFCDGMTDAIIGKLSGIAELKVISMTSVMRYKSADRDLKKIGKDLKVNTVLEGSIQRENGAIRVRAQLINVDDDAHLWSDHYDRELSSVFAIQDDISHAIADVMKIELLGEEDQSISQHGTENVEAFNNYCQGRFLWNKRTEADMRKSIEYFEKAIALDSNYALAWVGLADAWTILSDYSDLPDSVVLPHAREAVQKALNIDNKLGEAYASLALIQHADSAIHEAEKSYLRAIELNPGYVWSHVWYSILLKDNLGRLNDAIREENIAFELNPMSIPLILNRAYRKSEGREFEEAEELHRRAIEIEPTSSIGYWNYADHLKRMGKWDDALKQNVLAREHAPNWVAPHIGYAYALFQMGRLDEAIQHQLKATEINPIAFSDLAEYYCYRENEPDSAIRAANRYIESNPGYERTYFIKGKVLAFYGMLDSAIYYHQKAFELNPEANYNTGKLGQLYVAKQEYKEADSMFQVMMSHPDSIQRGWGRNRIAKTHFHQGKFQKGLQLLEDAIRTDHTELGASYPLFWKLHHHAFYNYMFVGNYESVLEKIKEARTVINEVTPGVSADDFRILLNGYEACVYLRTGQSSQAERLLTELEREMDTANFVTVKQSYFWLAMIQQEKGNFDSAVVISEKLLKLQIDFQNEMLLGISYLGAGRFDDAITLLETTMSQYQLLRLTYSAFSVYGHYLLGQAYEAAGRNPEAIVQYETFLDIWKNADEGLASVEDAKVRLNRLKGGS